MKGDKNMIITIQETKLKSNSYNFTVTKDENNKIKGYYTNLGKKHYVTAERVTRCNHKGEKYEIIEVKGKLENLASIS